MRWRRRPAHVHVARVARVGLPPKQSGALVTGVIGMREASFGER